MNPEDVLEGRIPEEIARDSAQLSALWSQLKASDKSLEDDPAAQDEWLARVESNAIRSSNKVTRISPEVLTQERQVEAALVKISKGEFNGMSDADFTFYKQRLLDMEKQVQNDLIAKNVAAGLPVTKPVKGEILNDLGKLLSGGRQ